MYLSDLIKINKGFGQVSLLNIYQRFMSCSNIQSFHYPNELDTGNNLCVLRRYTHPSLRLTISLINHVTTISLSSLLRLPRILYFRVSCIYWVIYESVPIFILNYHHINFPLITHFNEFWFICELRRSGPHPNHQPPSTLRPFAGNSFISW